MWIDLLSCLVVIKLHSHLLILLGLSVSALDIVTRIGHGLCSFGVLSL